VTNITLAQKTHEYGHKHDNTLLTSCY